MSLPPDIKSALNGFEKAILGAVPILLEQNDTALLSFMCDVAAVDALAAYRYSTANVGDRFADFIRNCFPKAYSPHADNLYVLRCRLLHNFSPAHFSLGHACPQRHLATSPVGDTILSDDVFFADLAAAARRFFAEVRTDPDRQSTMSARLHDNTRGGAIYSDGWAS